MASNFYGISFAGRLGLSTCYDVRFPEMYMELVDRGAEILLVPSAFTVPTGSAHWHTLLRGSFTLVMMARPIAHRSHAFFSLNQQHARLKINVSSLPLHNLERTTVNEIVMDILLW